MNREQKIAFAQSYATVLVEKHKEISAIVLSGSVARGNDLPISDIDLWCFVDDDHELLPIRKHSDADLYIDIEQRCTSEMIHVDIADDSYFLGYVHDAVVLFDRDGEVGRCQTRAREYLASPLHHERQLATVLESVHRNIENLAASADSKDAREACRASIFAAWSLADYMLVVKGVAPGGARGLARLAVTWTEAAEALLAFEGIAELDPPLSTRLVATYRSVADRGGFFATWLAKIEWMLANGYRADALHALWIALGLRIKDANKRDISVSPGDLERACSQWLDTIGWDCLTVRDKARELRSMSKCFCR